MYVSTSRAHVSSTKHSVMLFGSVGVRLSFTCANEFVLQRSTYGKGLHGCF